MSDFAFQMNKDEILRERTSQAKENILLSL